MSKIYDAVNAIAPNETLASLLQEIRIRTALAAIAIETMIASQGEYRIALLKRTPPRILAAAIISALDAGGTLDDATAAVIASIERK